MARAAAIAALAKGPISLFSLYSDLAPSKQAEVDEALQLLEQEHKVAFTIIPHQGEKIKVYYRPRKSGADKPTSPAKIAQAAGPKTLSPALQARLQRKREFMTPSKTRDPKRLKSATLLEQEETRLQSTIKTRKAQLEDLKRKKALAEKSANPGELERLQKLADKWGKASREIVRALQPYAGSGATLEDVLKAARVPPAMLGYNELEDDFTGPFKSLDQISRDAEDDADAAKTADYD